MGNNTITIKKDDLWKYSTFLLLAVVGIMGIVAFTGQTMQQPNPADTQAAQIGKIVVDIEGAVYMGDEKAPVTMIEFSDLECPFCKKHNDEAFNQIKEQYIDTGKVKYVFKHFTPTLVNPNYHPDAINAALSVECVREQGGNEAFWEMESRVFANQGANSVNNLKFMAQELGYDISACLDSEKYLDKIKKDFSDGQSAGIRGTPGFIINGNPVSGAQPFSVFQQVIESEL